MRTNRLLLAATVLSIVGIALASDEKAEKAIQEVSPYRSWMQVTPQPLQVDFGSLAG